MGALDPVREPRGPAGPRGPLVPVRLDLLVPVGGTNREQWALVLTHHHWPRLVGRTGTKDSPLWFGPRDTMPTFNFQLFQSSFEML